MVEEQRGACAICGRVVERLHIDHDHATGKIRGLLCNNCNRGLGLLGDKPEAMRRAAAYLDGEKGRVTAQYKVWLAE